jgi:hypothetical protein
MPLILLRGCWCDSIALNVNAPTEDKIDDMKNSFHKGPEHVFNEFPKYHMKLLLGDCKAKVDGEDIFKQSRMRVYMIIKLE